MSASPAEAFNEVAEKVVAFKELRQKTKAIYKEELSFGQKLFLNLVDKPASALIGLGVAVKDVATGSKKQGVYYDDSSFPPKMYVSGAFMNAMLKDTTRVNLSPKWDAMLVEKTRRAFDQCEDVSKTPKMQTLKPA